jgi:predicted Ser/Thr protein kinase
MLAENSPPTQPFEPLPPQIGRYRLLARLGAGGMGTVYKAEDPQLGRVVALKVPRFDGPPQDVARRVQRFQREARAAAQVWHPHVCPLYDVGEHEGQPYVVMAYIEGQSLAERLAGGGYEDVAEAVGVARQLLDALQAVHARGIVHRDLKPGNVMLDASSRAVLMDFGLARPEQEGEPFTTDGVVLGTPSYMAPEQAAGQGDRVGPWTDLYALGVVLYQMLTGRLPFEGPPLTVLAKIVHETPPPPRSLRPDLDPTLEAVLLKALAKDTEQRFQTARDFADALNGWLRGPGIVRPVAASTPAPVQDATLPVSVADPRRTPVPRSRRRAVRVDPVTGLIVILGGTVLLFAVVAHGMSRPEDWASIIVAGIVLVVGVAVLALLGRAIRAGRPDPSTVLLQAAEEGQVERVKKLIRKGVNLEARDEMGETALMKAAHKGYIHTVKLLLANGADVHAKNPFGETALSLASREGRAYIVELLRQAGARE